MDGNGRWARKRSLPRIAGHEAGVSAVRDVVEACCRLGIKVLTLYAFSSENWNRPSNEVNALMNLLDKYLRSELKKMLENNIRLAVIGEIDRLPRDVLETLRNALNDTKNNEAMILNLALGYGGRGEIIRAVRQIVSDCIAGKLSPSDINEESFSRYLFTTGLPDPDLLIRTAGEFRISNFLLWQLTYTEIYVTDTLWPDFRRDNLIKALEDYQNRERKFGLTSEQIKEVNC
jgi:undecaprenyl diphosphate synthase